MQKILMFWIVVSLTLQLSLANTIELEKDKYNRMEEINARLLLEGIQTSEVVIVYYLSDPYGEVYDESRDIIQNNDALHTLEISKQLAIPNDADYGQWKFNVLVDNMTMYDSFEVYEPTSKIVVMKVLVLLLTAMIIFVFHKKRQSD